MFASVRRLQSGGVLDDFEVRVLHDQIQVLVKNLATLPTNMKPVPSENLFLNITWVNGDKDLGEFLLSNSLVCDFDLGDLIVQDDEEPDSIFLIIDGLVKIIHGNMYEQISDSSLNDSLTSQTSLLENNANIDYASTGFVVGELGCLIGESAGVSVVCETSVSTYQIPVETIRLAFEKFPKLKDSLWKVVALKIAVPMLQKVCIAYCLVIKLQFRN